MGGMTVGRIVCYTERRLELTQEDLQIRQKRQALRQGRKNTPLVTEHERRFAEHLLKCPFCGRTPYYRKFTFSGRDGYAYKLVCTPHAEHKESMFLECGDWFDTPSKAGRDWNERVRKAKMNKQEREAYWELGKHRAELTRQQFRTLKGQIFAGDAEGAMCGLKRMMKERKNNGRDTAMQENRNKH